VRAVADGARAEGERRHPIERLRAAVAPRRQRVGPTGRIAGGRAYRLEAGRAVEADCGDGADRCEKGLGALYRRERRPLRRPPRDVGRARQLDPQLARARDAREDAARALLGPLVGQWRKAHVLDLVGRYA